MGNFPTKVQSENFRIPKLRFSEFEGEWEYANLGNCAHSFEYGMNASAIKFDGENRYIRITDIDESSSKYKPEFPVSPNGQLLDKYLVSENDILFARTGASTGKSYLYHKDDGKLYFAGFLIRAKIKEEYNSYFVFAQTKTVQYYKWVQLMSMRSGQPGINSQEYASYSFNIPSRNEQDKIASFLLLVDERISTQRKIIEKLETLIKGLSEKIFSKKIQFPEFSEDSWEMKTLAEVCEKAKSGGTPKSTVKEYYSGNIPFLSISDMTQQGKYLNSTERTISQQGLENSTSWIVPKNSIIYSMYASVGFVSINKIELATSQAVLNLIIKKEINTEFLYYYLTDFQKYLDEYITTGTQGNLNAETVKKFEIQTPTIEEQTKIANFLSSIQEKIETEKQILEKLELQKKFLLANLFV